MVELGDLVGRPFVKGGRNLGMGMDCWGLAMEIYKRYGIVLPDFTVDSFAFRAIDTLAGVEVESRAWEEVWKPQETDIPLVVLMQIHPKLVNHVGVLVEPNRVMHAMEQTGVVISRVAMLKSWITGYYRYVGNN